MATIGTLLIELSANVARLESDLTKATGHVRNTERMIQQSVDRMNGFFGLLGVGLSGAAMVGFIKHSIDAADELSKLSQKTGTAVSTLAGLKFAADQNGTSLESVAQASKKLSTAMVEQPDLFKKLGVTAKDSTGAMVQMADIFSIMPDGIEKTALAVKLMGKSGEEMIPFLNQGSASLNNLIEQGKKLNPVTAESAAQAERFNDQIDLMKAQSSMLGINLANSMLPALNNITSAMVDAQRESGTLKALWVGLGGLGAAIFTDDMLTREQQIEKRLKAINEQLGSTSLFKSARERISTEKTQLEAELAPIIAAREEAVAKKKELEKFREELTAMGIKPAQLKVYELARDGASNTDIEQAQQRVNRLKELASFNPAAAKKADPNDSTVANLQAEQFRKQMELLGVSAEQVKVYELSMHGATRAQLDQAQAVASTLEPINAELEARKKLQKQIEDAPKAGLIVAGMKVDFQTDIDKKMRDQNALLLSANDKAHLDNLAAVEQRSARAREELAKLNITEEERAVRIAEVNRETELQKMRMDELRISIDQNNQSWLYGAQVAMRAYLDEAANTAKQSEQLFGGAFRGMENSLAHFLRTGTLDFQSFTNAVLDNLAQIAAQKMEAGIMGSIISAFSATPAGASNTSLSGSKVNLGNSGGGYSGIVDGIISGARASGGPVAGGKTYLVGEQGPELFTAPANGSIVSNRELGARAQKSTVIQLHYAPVTHIDARSDINQVRQIAEESSRRGSAELVDTLQRQGVIA